MSDSKDFGQVRSADLVAHILDRAWMSNRFRFINIMGMSSKSYNSNNFDVHLLANNHVCVCVCVCVREREREHCEKKCYSDAI